MANIHTLTDTPVAPLEYHKKNTGTTSHIDKNTFNNERKEEIGFFYIIRTPDTPDDVYKIGKTTNCDPNKRLCKYPKYSIVKYTIAVENADMFEDIVMRKFKSIFKRRRELGLEYYEGDIIKMISEVHNLWLKYGNVKTTSFIKNKAIENIKPNGWQYFVNEWLSRHLFASDDEIYEGYVKTIKTDFGSNEYAEKPFFLAYLHSTNV
jgi:hypothetical protein